MFELSRRDTLVDVNARADTISQKKVPPVGLTSGKSKNTAAARPTANAVRAMKKKATPRGS
jgi:hypothetical protein